MEQCERQDHKVQQVQQELMEQMEQCEQQVHKDHNEILQQTIKHCLEMEGLMN